MVAFLANGIMLLFFLAIAAVYGLIKLIIYLYEDYRGRQFDKEWEKRDPETCARIDKLIEDLKRANGH